MGLDTKQRDYVSVHVDTTAHFSSYCYFEVWLYIKHSDKDREQRTLHSVSVNKQRYKRLNSLCAGDVADSINRELILAGSERVLEWSGLLQQSQ